MENFGHVTHLHKASKKRLATRTSHSALPAAFIHILVTLHTLKIGAVIAPPLQLPPHVEYLVPFNILQDR